MSDRFSLTMRIGGDVPASAARDLLAGIADCDMTEDRIRVDPTDDAAETLLALVNEGDDEAPEPDLDRIQVTPRDHIVLRDHESAGDTFDKLRATCQRLGIAYDIQADCGRQGDDSPYEARWRPGMEQPHYWCTDAYGGYRLVDLERLTASLDATFSFLRLAGLTNQSVDTLLKIEGCRTLADVMGPRVADLGPFSIDDTTAQTP